MLLPHIFFKRIMMITYKISKDNTPYYVASVEWTGRKWERTTNGSMIMTEDIISDKYGLIISDRRSTAYIR
jgi:hypothetical protein